MIVRYLTLDEYLAIASAVTALNIYTVVEVADLNLADSALHAPATGFAGVEKYPDFVTKAAVLIVRLAKNHPLPDGNKRAAWVALRVFVELNGWEWVDYPDVETAETAVLAIAAGDWDETVMAAWLRPLLRS